MIAFIYFLQVVNTPIPTGHLKKTLISLGMVPNGMPFPGKYSESYIVVLDGKIVGRVHDDEAEEFIAKLRYRKATGKEVCEDFLSVV